MEGVEGAEKGSSQGSKEAHAEKLYEQFWQALAATKVSQAERVRKDLITWRRGSAQMVLKINPTLNNISLYSVLVADVEPSEALFRHLLAYNVLQRRESLGLVEKDGCIYIVMKYTMELEVVTVEALQRHVYAFQEIADQLDTELVKQFGGSLRFEEWTKLNQEGVDTLLDDLFG